METTIQPVESLHRTQTVASINSVFSNQAFAGKHIVILGFARQGISLARFFVRAGAAVTISDQASADQLSAERQKLDGLPIRYVLGEHPLSLLDPCHLLCLSGGVPPQLPIVQEAIRRGIPLSNDSLLTCQLTRLLGLGPLAAITGSSGKTTTTTLVGRMLEAAFSNNHANTPRASHVGGNIGMPILDRLHDIYPDEPIVLELSSFQLELFNPAIAYGNFEEIGPQVAALLNITPNHLDRHPDMAAYTAAKLNLIRHMPKGATLVISLDDPVTARLLPNPTGYALPKLPPVWKLDALLEETRALIGNLELRVIPFSRRHILSTGAWFEDDNLILNGCEICRRAAVQLPGDHNISNLLAAIAIADSLGVSPAAMRSVAESFTGVAHRLEIVSRQNDVTWINDSIATSPERAIAGLCAVDDEEQTIILLAGGKDKNLPWDTFATEIVNRVDYLIGFGQSGAMIVELVQDRARYQQHQAPNCAVVQRLDEAVSLAGRIARPKTTVLLSPGGTSYDSYKDFEARGEHFRRLVAQQLESLRQNGTTPSVTLSSRN